MLGYGTGKRGSGAGGGTTAAQVDTSAVSNVAFIGADLATMLEAIDAGALTADLGNRTISGGRAEILAETGDASGALALASATHAGRLVVITDPDPVRVSLDGLAVGESVTLIQGGAGALTCAVGSGALINGVAEAGAGEADVATADAWDMIWVQRLDDDGAAHPRFLVKGDLA